MRKTDGWGVETGAACLQRGGTTFPIAKYYYYYYYYYLLWNQFNIHIYR